METKASLYETDIALWSEQTARLLRERRFSEVDIDHVAEEIESLGRSDKRQLRNRVIEIIEHKLKLTLTTGTDREHNERSWNNSVFEQQRGIGWLFEESPSLRSMLTPDLLKKCYQAGVQDFAASDFGCYANAPRECPFTWEEILGEHPAEAPFGTVNLFPKHTGLPFVVWISVRGGARHDVRVKVSANAKAIPGEMATVGLCPVRVIEGEIEARAFAQLRAWIELNQSTLLQYWEGDIDAQDAVSALVKLKLADHPAGQ